jgi:FixJ family two-component response regulator
MSDPTTDRIIAVVDDDPRVLESLENLLESAGHVARLFDCAAALLDSGSLQEIDCLISDVGLPGMGGLQLMQIVHRTRPRLPVILITGQPSAMPPQSLTAPPDPFDLFCKPFDGQELLASIARALRESSANTPPVRA